MNSFFGRIIIASKYVIFYKITNFYFCKCASGMSRSIECGESRCILDTTAVRLCARLPSLSVVHTKQGSQSFLQFACLLTIAVRQSIFRGKVRSCTNILCLFVAFYCASNR